MKEKLIETQKTILNPVLNDDTDSGHEATPLPEALKPIPFPYEYPISIHHSSPPVNTLTKGDSSYNLLRASTSGRLETQSSLPGHPNADHINETEIRLGLLRIEMNKMYPATIVLEQQKQILVINNLFFHYEYYSG
jgi:hypothetical protein